MTDEQMAEIKSHIDQAFRRMVDLVLSDLGRPSKCEIDPAAAEVGVEEKIQRAISEAAIAIVAAAEPKAALVGDRPPEIHIPRAPSTDVDVSASPKGLSDEEPDGLGS